MNKTDTFENFLRTYSAQIPLAVFLLNLVLSAVLAWLLGQMYSRYGASLSNRRQFARNFVLLAATTMLIITIVKSSLALSLGLVGALSIVRFRAAIKEPEELMYLFLCIAIGLGLGADQREVTLLGFVFISLLIWLTSRRRAREENQNLYLTVSSDRPGAVRLEQILDTLKKYCDAASLNRFDESKDLLEASLQVEIADIQKLSQCRAELRGLDESVTISFLQNRGI
jgi:uncharacterized membrane protein YhiD involved in acid resistance